jgi:hypothetical protein
MSFRELRNGRVAESATAIALSHQRVGTSRFSSSCQFTTTVIAGACGKVKILLPRLVGEGFECFMRSSRRLPSLFPSDEWRSAAE